MNRFKTKELDQKATDVDEAMNSLVRLLATRERSIYEAYKRLSEKGYSADASSTAIERAMACGLLDDQHFADALIHDKVAAGWGKRRIELELFRFGIAQESIEGYPQDFFSEEDQLAKALELLRRHHSRAKNPRQAAYRYLVRKGYSSEIASLAIKISEGFEAEY